MKLFLVLLALLIPSVSSAAPKPKLVVVVAVDQLRNDYLTRFEKYFLPAKQEDGKPGGFKVFMDRGAYFVNAQEDHELTTTGVGHAALLTGAYPYLHGIVSHRWFDDELGRVVYCAEDPKASPVLSPGKAAGAEDEKAASSGRSPRNLLVTTVGDELKNAFGGQPRVVSIALKDRAAIMMGGHRADLVLWFNEKSGWVTSSYYAPKLPDWLNEWNTFDYRKKKVPAEWTKLLPEADYAYSLKLPPETVGAWTSLGKAFPHPIKDTSGFITSPWGEAFTFDTALEAVRAMKLGQGKSVDLLAISLSSFDALGHNFGPLSEQMEDATLRTDRMLADFLAALDRAVPGGLSQMILVLAADHGSPINPALAEKLNLPGGVYWPKALQDKANEFLRKRFGFASGDRVITTTYETNIHFDHAVLGKAGKDSKEVARALAEWLREQPFVAAAYAKADLLAGAIPPTQIARRMAVSAHPLRSGDVVFVARPGQVELPDNTKEGLTHGSATYQEANIPLALVGAAFKPGRYAQEVIINDLAPTLSVVLGITAPSGSEGKPLVPALAGQALLPH